MLLFILSVNSICNPIHSCLVAYERQYILSVTWKSLRIYWAVLLKWNYSYHRTSKGNWAASISGRFHFESNLQWLWSWLEISIQNYWLGNLCFISSKTSGIFILSAWKTWHSITGQVYQQLSVYGNFDPAGVIKKCSSKPVEMSPVMWIIKWCQWYQLHRASHQQFDQLGCIIHVCSNHTLFCLFYCLALMLALKVKQETWYAFYYLKFVALKVKWLQNYSHCLRSSVNNHTELCLC